MFDSEKAMTYNALMGWAKYIETGDFGGPDKETILKLALTDPDMRRVSAKLPNLSRDQQRVVIKLEDLANKVLNGGQLDD